MLDRLKDNDLTKIAEYFCEHPLMKSCQRTFKRYQAKMRPLLFAPEEVFCEAAIIIDHILEQPQTNEVQTYIASLWDELRIKMSKWEKTASPKNLDMAVSAVLYTVAIAMDRHWATFYNFDVTQWLLKAIIDNMKVDHQEMVHVFNDLLEEGDRIEDWINDEAFGLSDEIEKVIKQAPFNPPPANTYIFDYRLKESQIITTIRGINRKELGDINFAYAIHSFLESIKWLADTKDNDFTSWMRGKGLITVSAKNFVQATPDDERVKGLILDLRSVFQEIHPETGLWRDKKEFYLPDKILINTGEKQTDITTI